MIALTGTPRSATIDPRSDGSASIVALGAALRTARVKVAASSGCKSIAKKRGALAGAALRNSAPRLESITASATNSEKPSPSATTSRSVWAPGRCKLAIASRSNGRRARGSRAAIARIATPQPHNSAINARIAPTKPNASQRSDAVATASAISATIKTIIPPNTPRLGQRRADSVSRSSVAAGTERARASAGSAKSSATNTDSIAAVSKGTGYTPSRGGTGNAEPANAVTIHGSAAPTMSPAPMPTAATTPSCARKIAAIVRDRAPNTFSVAMIFALPAR